MLLPPLAPKSLLAYAPLSPIPTLQAPTALPRMAAAPFAGYELVPVEPAMGFHQGRHLMLAAGVHLVKPLAATRNPAGGVRAVAAAATGYGVAVPLPPAAGSLPAATGGFGAGAEERASRGPRFVCAAAGHGDAPAALVAASYSSTGQVGAGDRPGAFPFAGVLAGGRFRAMSVVAKAGDEPTDPEDSDVEKVEEYIRKRKAPIDSIFSEIHDFYPVIAMPQSFAICRDKDMLQMFARQMKVCYGSILHVTLEFQAPTPMNHESLVMIGKDPKMVALECEKGFLQAETLDKAVASLKRLRATSLGCAEQRQFGWLTALIGDRC